MGWDYFRESMCAFGGSKSPKPMQVPVAPQDDSAQRAEIDKRVREQQAMSANAGRKSTIFAGAQFNAAGMQRRIRKQRAGTEGESGEVL